MDTRRRIFKYFALMIFGVFILNTLANYFFWYSSIKQFDILMHFLGGFTAGIFSFWLIYKRASGLIDTDRISKVVRIISMMVLIIALLWEILEFSVQGFFNVTILADVPDSISDVLVGLLGGILGSLFSIMKYKKHNNLSQYE